VLVNGKRVTIPSYQVKKGDVIQMSPKAQKMIVLRHNIDTIDRAVPMWLEVTADDFKAVVRDLPLRDQIDVPVREQLIVELYSK
jgi:small subunit ribosomal protein S4